jgi:hypothetical protein
MKSLILLFSLLSSVSAFASTATVSPASPVVIQADFRDAAGDYIQAPWLRAVFTVQASEVITVTGVSIKVTSAKGSVVTMGYQLPMGGVEVAAGASYTLPLGYLFNLGPVDETVYTVVMQYEGWLGTAAAPTGRLNLTSTFITQ